MAGVDSQTSASSTSDLSDEEVAIYREYWRLLRSGLPAEWTIDERAALKDRLVALRDREACAMLDAAQAGDVPEFDLRRERYEALARAVPEQAVMFPAQLVRREE